jgi:lipoprotein-anchoring transpeptidase ErfK/SrfK
VTRATLALALALLLLLASAGPEGDAHRLTRSAPSAALGTKGPHPARAEPRPWGAAMRLSHPARPARPPSFLAARPRGPLRLRSRPGGRTLTNLAPRSEFGSSQRPGVVRTRGAWLGLTTPALGNGRLGWVRRSEVALARTRVSLRVDLSARVLILHRGRRQLRRLSVAIGSPQSPTPRGRFAVTDRLSGARFSPAYGCCILALSGHQPHPPAGWRSGNRLAIHGTQDPASIGRGASAGCLRAAEDDLRALMRAVPLGAPVFIHG